MKLITIKISKIIGNEEIVFYPVLIEAPRRNYLIDCGYEETVDEFISGLRKLKIELSDLYGIIITHDDPDHLGGLYALKQKNKNLKIFCSEQEENSISGSFKSERLIQAEKLLHKIPEKYKYRGLEFIHELESIKRCGVDKILIDNEVFENEIVVIHTPGHTKGHLSFYYPAEKTVITGDAIVYVNNELDIASPNFTLDKPEALNSVEKIKNLKPERLICYHGGIVEDNINERLEKLLEKYKKYR